MKRRVSFWFAMTVGGLLAAALLLGSFTERLEPVSATSITDPTQDEISEDVAVITLGNWNKKGEGSATTDLSGNTQLTIGSGAFHTNGDLKVQNPSHLFSFEIVSARRDLICTNPNLSLIHI